MLCFEMVMFRNGYVSKCCSSNVYFIYQMNALKNKKYKLQFFNNKKLHLRFFKQKDKKEK